MSALVAWTINHKTAPQTVREELRLTEPRAAALRTLLAAATSEHLVLCTCERLEVYAVVDEEVEEHAAECVSEFLTRPASAPGTAVKEQGSADRPRCIGVMTGTEAVRHLLRVAAGLESRIVGEPHVLGQVRQAYLAGLEERTLGPILAALGRAAIHAGKRVRHETTINPTARSIVTVTLDALRRSLGELSRARVVIVGSGRLAGDLAAVLAYCGAKLRLASRSAERARSMAQRHQAPAGGLEELPEFMRDADAVITCSSATEAIVTRETLRAAGRAAGGRCLAIVDLAVPRNVDAGVAAMAGVTVESLDDLLAREGARCGSVSAAADIVAEETARFGQWLRARAAAPRIAQLSARRSAEDRIGKESARQWHRRIMGLKCATVK